MHPRLHMREYTMSEKAKITTGIGSFSTNLIFKEIVVHVWCETVSKNTNINKTEFIELCFN